MTVRALLTGTALGILVSLFTYFNDHVIRQSFFVGHHLPVSVLGIFLFLVLFVNPILRRFGSDRSLKPSELAWITALGMVACGWPGSSLMRYYTGLVAVPAMQYESNTVWQSARVMTYVPGGSHLLGEGHISDWDDFIAQIGPGAQNRIAKKLRESLSPEIRSSIDRCLEQKQRTDSRLRGSVLDALNESLKSPELFSEIDLPHTEDGGIGGSAAIEKMNRHILTQALPGLVVGAPPGKGVLLASGNGHDPAVTLLARGWEGTKQFGLNMIPWNIWKPTLLFWGALVLLISAASVSIIFIVQPQWKRELLPYPIARFVQELSGFGSSGTTSGSLRLFWYGFALMTGIHLVNGLYRWFPQSIEIPLRFDFEGLYSAFDNAFLSSSWGFFARPTIFPTVVAFAFFLSTQVSFSVGIAPVLYSFVYMLLINNGIWVATGSADPGNFPLMRMGGYVGIVLMMLYVGRRYYAAVVGSSLGFVRDTTVTPGIKVAFWVLVSCCLASVWLLAANGLEWIFAALIVLLTLILFVVLTRINAETGVFFHQPNWLPAIALVAIFGNEALGPTNLLMMYLVSMLLAGDVRETLLPFFANAFYMVTERAKPLPSPRGVAVLAAMALVALALAAVATLYIQYSRGLPYYDTHATASSPAVSFDKLSRAVTELSVFDELSRSVGLKGLDRLRAARPNGALIGWFAAGIGLVVAAGILRTRFVWWPIHPVLFVVWGTFFPGNLLGFSFLLGWFVKSAVVRFSGAKGYQSVKPFMFGIISGELLAGLGWITVGVCYYLLTGAIPKAYEIFWGVVR